MNRGLAYGPLRHTTRLLSGDESPLRRTTLRASSRTPMQNINGGTWRPETGGDGGPGAGEGRRSGQAADRREAQDEHRGGHTRRCDDEPATVHNEGPTHDPAPTAQQLEPPARRQQRRRDQRGEDQRGLDRAYLGTEAPHGGGHHGREQVDIAREQERGQPPDRQNAIPPRGLEPVDAAPDLSGQTHNAHCNQASPVRDHGGLTLTAERPPPR